MRSYMYTYRHSRDRYSRCGYIGPGCDVTTGAAAATPLLAAQASSSSAGHNHIAGRNDRPSCGDSPPGCTSQQRFGFYKIFVHCKAFVYESIILYCYPPHLHCQHYCNTSSRLAQNTNSPRPPYGMPYTIPYC